MPKVYRDTTHAAANDLVIGVGVVTASVLPTTATAYKRGDVVTVDAATNVATHPATATGFQAIVAENVSAEQATSHAASSTEIPVYVSGEFNAFECSVSGTKLDKAGRLAARAHAVGTGLPLTIKLPDGKQDV